MVYVQDGQCGMCVHWGEGANDQPRLLQIRATHDAPCVASAEAEQLHVSPQESGG